MSKTTLTPNLTSTIPNRSNPYYERDAFTKDPLTSTQYFSGANCLVYFDHVLVDEMDSGGFQLSQNAQPIYGYHSYVWNDLQYGGKLVQGYFQLHLTEGAYLPAMLSVIENNRRTGGNPMRKLFPSDTYAPQRPWATPYDAKPALGLTLEEALQELAPDHYMGDQEYINSVDEFPYWQIIADDYDSKHFGRFTHDIGVSNSNMARYPDSLNNGFLNKRPCENEFSYNPRGSVLHETGFTMTFCFGDVDMIARQVLVTPDSPNPAVPWTVIAANQFPGTVIQLHEAHIIAGPNMQIDLDGKPIAQLYTFLARDIS